MLSNWVDHALNSLPAQTYQGMGNFSLSIEVGNGTFATDPDTGNEIEASEQSTITLTMRESRQEAPKDIPGVDTASLYLVGRSLSISVPTSRWIDATLTDIATEEAIAGEFYAVPVVQSRFAAITNKLGMKVRGFFRTAGGGA